MAAATITPVELDRRTRIGRRLVLFPARAFLALGWIRAGVEKVIDPSWWSGEYLRGFLGDHEAAMLSFVGPFSAGVDGGTAVVLSAAVVMAELAIGVCLLTGRSLRLALWGACVLNVAFVAFGAVAPSAFYLVLQLTLLLDLAVRGPMPRRRVISAIVMSWIGAVCMLPFVRTLHPHAVIDDPAIMLATLAALVGTTLTILLVERGVTGLPRQVTGERSRLSRR